MFIQEKQAIEIKKLLTLATGQDCSDISNKKMLNILEKRLKELKFNDFNNYLKYLNQNSLKEISQLKENVDIEKYAFFEFKFHHDKISKEISGNNVSNKLPKELNILSIESGKGEFSYSNVLFFKNLFEKLYSNCKLNFYSMFADVKGLNHSQNGVYLTDCLIKQIPSEYHKYFKKGKGELSKYIKIQDEIKKIVSSKCASFKDKVLPYYSEKFDYVLVDLNSLELPGVDSQSILKKLEIVTTPESKVFIDPDFNINPFGSSFNKNSPGCFVRTKTEAENVATFSYNKIRLLIVDDSKTIHTLLNKVFEDIKGFDIIGSCYDGEEALNFLSKNSSVDVILSDINMPKMDGLTLLKKQMAKYKIPTLMLSAISKDEGSYLFDALDAGAIDYLEKPSTSDLSAISNNLLEKIKIAKDSKNKKNTVKNKGKVVNFQNIGSQDKTIILIGSSTGGPQALLGLFKALPNNLPPILVSQHMPKEFVAHFCKRLTEQTEFQVSLGSRNDKLLPGHIYFSEGDKHMKLVNKGNMLGIDYDNSGTYKGPTSVDCLFHSAAKYANEYDFISIILTGMGKDGAEGMKKLHDQGVYTIAQDEKSSVVWGMAGTAVSYGAADVVLDIDDIPQEIVNHLNKKIQKSA